MRDLKAYREKLNSLLTEANDILNAAAEQTRAMTAEEESAYNAKNKEYEELKRTYELLKNQHTMPEPTAVSTDPELRDFERFIRSSGHEKTRAMTSTDNGVLVPKTILNNVIKKVDEISPLAGRVVKYYSAGDLVFPQIGFKDDTIQLKYVAEGDSIPETDAKFDGVTLKNNMFCTMVKISEKMLSDTEFDVIGYIVQYVAEKAAEFVEYVLINGATDTKGKTVSTGAISATNQLTTAAAGKVTADEFIDLVMSIPQKYRMNAMLILTPEAMKQARKLKDNNGNYLFVANNAQTDLPTILNVPSYASASVPVTHVGVIVDPSGMAWKIGRDFETRVLDQLYADKNQIGIKSTIHMDTGIVNQQKVGALKYHTA